MSLGIVLDVAIGLVFTYLLLALLASGVQELFAGLLQLRGKRLRDALQRLLETPTDVVGHPSLDLFNRISGHSLVLGTGTTQLPSYVPARNISLAVLDTLMDGSQATVFSQVESTVSKLPDSGIKSTFTALLTQAGGDVDKFKVAVESWYDDAMDRVSGAYKRFSHYCLLGLGLALALILNVDSVRIADTLWHDAGLRAVVVQQAAAFNASTAAPSADAKPDVKKAQEALNSLPLPLGWNGRDLPTGWNWIWAIVGWLITAFAIALGAPFWFNALDSLLKLRNAGAKPQRASEPG